MVTQRRKRISTTPSIFTGEERRGVIKRPTEPPVELVSEEKVARPRIPIQPQPLELPKTQTFSLISRLYPRFPELKPEELSVEIKSLRTLVQEDPEGFLTDLNLRASPEDRDSLLRILGASKEDIISLQDFSAQQEFTNTLTDVFPDIASIEDFTTLAEDDFDEFVERMQTGGDTIEKQRLLQFLGIEEDLADEILGTQRIFVELDGIRQQVLRTPDNSLYKDGQWVGFYNWADGTVFNPYKATGLVGKTIASLETGIGDILMVSSGVAERFGYSDVASKLSTTGAQLQRSAVPTSSADFEVSDLLNPEFYATKIARTIPFALALAPLAIGGFYAGGGVAAAVGLGTIWQMIVGGLAGAALSRPLESALEAGGSYNDAIARGKTEKEAEEEFDEVFRNNMTLVGADAFQIAIALAPTPKWVPSALVKGGLARTVRIGGKIIIVGLSEGGEEVYQDLIQRHARGEEFQLDPISKEVFAIGFVMGAGMGLGGDVISGIVNTSKDGMSAQQRREFDETINRFGEEGINQSESELRALDGFMKTPEGEKIVNEAIEENRPEEIPTIEPTAAPTPITEPVVAGEVKPQGIVLPENDAQGFTGSAVGTLGIKGKVTLRYSDKPLEERYGEWKEISPNNFELTIDGSRSEIAIKDTIIHELTHIQRIQQGLPKQVGFHSSDFYRSWGANRELLGQPITPIEELTQPPVTPEVVEAPPVEVVSDEKGDIIPPVDEVIPTSVDANSTVIHDIGIKELVRGTRHVFEKMGIYEIWDGVTEAEVDISDANTAFVKEVDALAKKVGKDKERWGLIFDEVNESGSVVGLTFEEKQVVNFIRKWANDWADKKNLPASKRIKDYIPHLFEQEMIDQIKADRGIPPEIASILSTKVQTKITDPFLKERLGAVGFIRDPFSAMKAYNAASNRVLYYEPFLQKIAVIANDTSIPQRSREYLKDYSRRMTGEPSKLDLAINKTLAEIGEVIRKLPGGKGFADLLTQGNPSGLAAYQTTSALYTLFLGFKVTSAIRNLSQHGLIIGEIGPKHFAKGIGLRFTEEGQTVEREVRIKRGRRRAFTPGIDASFADNWVGKFREVAMFTFRGADAQNVSNAVLGGYSEAKEILTEANERASPDKKLSLEELRGYMIRRGDEVGMDTQFLYTKMNSMAISQNAPGRVLSMLTTWTENWIELMGKWITRRPSKVYAEFSERTGVDVKGANWATSYKAIGMYLAIGALAYTIKERERLKALEYTGITSLRYLAGTVGGEFPALQAPGAVMDIVNGALLNDETMIKRGWGELKRVLTPGILNQVMDVALGEKDWLTLFFYLEGKDFKIGKLKDEWEKGFEPYEDLTDPLIRAEKYPTLNANTARKRWREENPLIEAQMFVVGQFTTLSSEEARKEVLRLIEANKLDPDLIDGYDKVFGIDTNVELNASQKRIGNLEKLVIGEEAEYYDIGRFTAELHQAVNSQGRSKVERDGHPLALEILHGEDFLVSYFNLEETDARKLWRQQFPEGEAMLYFLGKIGAFENPESAKELLRLMDKYGIPPQAINAFQQDPSKYDELFTQKFELEQKNFDLTTEYENFANSEAPNYIEDSDLRKEAREKFKEDNPDWVADQRRIEAIDNDASPEIIEKWAERGKVIDEFSPTGSEAQAWLLDNPDTHKWALDNELLTDDGSDWNEDVIRLNVKMRKLDEQYDELSTEGTVRDDFLKSHPEYNDDRRRRTMFGLDASDELVKEFVDYGHVIDEFSSGSSQAKLFRIDHPDLSKFGEDEDTLGWEKLKESDIPVWRIDVEFETQDNEYQAILDRIEDSVEQTRATDAYLLANPEYHKKRFEREAIRLEFTRVDEYVDWYTDPILRRPDDYDASLPFYEDDWYLMEHIDFYKAMLEAEIFTTRRDFRLVPDRAVGKKYIEYLSIKNNQSARDQYRIDNSDLDEWGVSVGIWVRTMSEKRRREEQTATERFEEKEAEDVRKRREALRGREELK